jgi:hypothetical protein
MKYLIKINVIFFGLVALVSVAAAAPLPGASWDWQLGETIDPPAGIQVFDAEPDSVTREQIMALNEAGIYTICYVSTGTIEDYRDDVNAFPASVVGKTYGDWPDEKFLDIRAIDVLLPLMQARFERCRDLGFQAIEPDNQDSHDNDTGFDISSPDVIAYLKALATLAHDQGMEIGQKNISDLTDQLVGIMDFVVTEDCFFDGWCDEVLPYIAAGKPVFDAEYTDTGVDFAAACAYEAEHKVSMILKDRDLTIGLESCP